MNDLFEGSIDVEIQAQRVVTRAQRRLIREAFGDGTDVPQEVRFSCRVAMDVNDAIRNGIVFENGATYEPNPKAPAQFGKNSRGMPYLTFGLIDPKTSRRYRVTWEGAAVPLTMVRTAIAHDEGRNVSATSVWLPFEKAKVREIPPRSAAPRRTRRKETAERRVHSRICRSDLEMIEALRKAHTN